MTNTAPGILIVLLLAHLLADFLFQTNKMAEKRFSGKWNEMLCWNIGHALIHFIVSSVLLYLTCSFYNGDLFNHTDTVLLLILLSFFHLLTDLLKSGCILLRPFEKYSINLFLADQLIHLFSAIWISYSIHKHALAFPDIAGALKNGIFLNANQKFFLALVLITAALFGAGIFIRVVFSYMDKVPYRYAINKRLFIKGITYDNKNNISPDISFLIGVLERLFIIVVLATGANEQIIGFILTAKSVARFKEFDDKNFVVNYIVGTFISFISAIIIGITIKRLGVFPTLFN